MFLKNKNIIFKIRRSKVTDYAALSTLRHVYILVFKYIFAHFSTGWHLKVFHFNRCVLLTLLNVTYVIFVGSAVAQC